MPKPDTNPTTNQPQNPGFREVHRLSDPDGVSMQITERLSDGRISFSFVREFEVTVNGQKVTKQTNFLSPRHLPAVQRLITDALEQELLDLCEDRARAARRTA